MATIRGILRWVLGWRASFLVTVDLTLEPRTVALTLADRSLAFTLEPRTVAFTLADRSTAFTLESRSLAFTLPDKPER